MAKFEPAYELTKEAEGGYANNPNDRGQETYAGISRKFNPEWPGWHIIDEFKRHHTLTRNEKLQDPELNAMVEDFYRQRFHKIRANELASQALANLYFDFHVHSGWNAIIQLQKAVNDLAFPKVIMVDGIIGPMTLNAANSLKAGILHDRYKQRRKEFLERIIHNDPSQEVFRAGWLARLAQFPDLLEKKKK